ncbi:MAG: hypothetical protein K8F31_04640 [Roseovarius sp.]|nr:hypothetical protein [Roseovarius sp.]
MNSAFACFGQGRFHSHLPGRFNLIFGIRRVVQAGRSSFYCGACQR